MLTEAVIKLVDDRLVTSLVYCAISHWYYTSSSSHGGATSSALAHLDRWGLRGGRASRSYLYKHVSITKGDMACDVMSRLSDPHLRKLATYSHAFKIASCEVFLQ